MHDAVADVSVAVPDALPAVAGGAAPAGATRPQRAQRDSRPLSRSEVARLQRSGGNAAAIAGIRRALAPPRTASRAMIQRDAAAQKLIIDALAKPAPEPGTGQGAGVDPAGANHAEAFRILNGLAMYDMLSTLTALQRSGQFTTLNGNFQWATGVYVARLQLAFAAVVAKGANTPEMFMFQHGPEMTPLPQDQRQDIIKYLDPAWFDSLKSDEEAKVLLPAIRGAPDYGKLAPEDQTLTEEIITVSQKDPPSLVYHLTKLMQLFNTPLKPAQQISDETSAATGTAAAAEAKRVAKPAAAKNTGVEEKAAGSKKRVWTPMKGTYGGTYYVDRSDPTNIVVKCSVFLKPLVSTDAKVKADSKTATAAIRKMEDAIEKSASTTGYVVDITFVKAPTGDSFNVDVDPSRWEYADNWAGGDPVGFAHELHHLMAFPLDRYDYIESHAANESMTIPQRLYWFRQELDKPPGYNDPTSIMNNASHPNDDDVCRVAGLDPAQCVALRQKAAKARAKGGTP
jgi:hypothetical protein